MTKLERRAQDGVCQGTEEGEAMSEGNISEVFAGIVNLAKELGVKSIGKLEAPWEHRLDETWEFAVNGQNRSVKWRFTTLDAFSFIGLRNGFPVILGDPYGGTVMGTGPEVEDELIERLSAAIERERQISSALFKLQPRQG